MRSFPRSRPSPFEWFELATGLLCALVMLLLVAMVLTTAPECDTPELCRELASKETNTTRAKEFQQRAVALEALKNAMRRANAVKLAPSAPPLVEAVGTDESNAQLLSGDETDVQPSPTLSAAGERETGNETPSTPPLVTGVPLPSSDDPPAAVAISAESGPFAPPTRVGISAAGGVEFGPETSTSLSGTWQARARVGLGARFSLIERRATSGLEAVPAVTLLTGYAGRFVDPTDHRVFGEARLELLAARTHGMLGPAFTAYLITGVDVFIAGSGLPAEPYVGAGVGWDVNPFAGQKGAARPSKPVSLGNPFSGLGHLGGGGGGAGAILLIPVAIAAAAVVVGAAIAYVCAGRLEVRYRPWTRSGQPSVAMMLGYGF